tara:strand:- start:1998 stop:2792 length:795 start_codon:yes stop_codon:yes gene_type:complete
MISRPIIVTSLFNIGRDVWDTYTVSYHTYLWWMKNTLSLDAEFVIYTDELLYDKIIAIRKEFDPTMISTKIIKCSLKNIPSFKMYNKRLEMLMYSEDFKKKIVHQVPEMTKPLYNTIIFNKLGFIKDAKDNKYFPGDFYIWADAGGLRDDLQNYKSKSWPNLEKLNLLASTNKVTFFSHQPDFSITDSEYHALSQIRYIQGGSIFCPPDCIDDLHVQFNRTVNQCLNSGYIGSEEKILDITYHSDKTKYNLITCDWREYYDKFL